MVKRMAWPDGVAAGAEVFGGARSIQHAERRGRFNLRGSAGTPK